MLIFMGTVPLKMDRSEATSRVEPKGLRVQSDSHLLYGKIIWKPYLQEATVFQATHKTVTIET